MPANVPYACTDYGALNAIKTIVANKLLNNPTTNKNDDSVVGAMERDIVTPILAITDGTSNTILVAEDAARPLGFITGGKQVFVSPTYPASIFKEGAWADPIGAFSLDGSSAADGTTNSDPVGHDTCSMNCTNNSEVFSFHTGGSNFVFADGSVRFLRDSLTVKTLAQLITRSGGELVQQDY